MPQRKKEHDKVAFTVAHFATTSPVAKVTYMMSYILEYDLASMSLLKG